MANHGERMTPMIRSSLCDYSGAYIHVKGTITIPSTGTLPAPNNANKKEIFKNCASFTNFISKINNTRIDDANDTDVVMPMYNLIEYSDICSETSLLINNIITNFPTNNNNNSISFKFKQKITGETGNGVSETVLVKQLKMKRKYKKLDFSECYYVY